MNTYIKFNKCTNKFDVFINGICEGSYGGYLGAWYKMKNEDK